MANNLNMLDAIIAAKLGKGTGGGSGSVTKEYVDTQVGAVSERVDDVESVIPSAATPQNPLATASDVFGTAIPSTSTTSPLTDSADGMVQGLTVKGKSRKTKNLLEITATTTTKDGITFTVNNDGTIKVTGTATALTYLEINNLYDDGLIDNVTYILNGCPTGGDTGGFKYRLDFSLNVFSDYGEGVEFTTTDYTSSAHNVRIVIFNGYACPSGGLIFKPMICTAADYAADPTFEPYFEAIKSIGDAGWGVVDLGTLTWGYITGTYSYFKAALSGAKRPPNNQTASDINCSKYTTDTADNVYLHTSNKIIAKTYNTDDVWIYDDTYPDATSFKSAMSGVLLYYPLADTTGAAPILGITSKNGEGQGTAATITTGLPLRSVSDTVRDKLICTGDVKQVETVCDRVRLADLTWKTATEGDNSYYATISTIKSGTSTNIICNKYPTVVYSNPFTQNKSIAKASGVSVIIKDNDYTTVSDFVASLGDAELVYELAEPVTIPLTDTEISAFRGLKTYGGTTNITISDEPDFELDYLKNSENGQAVANVQKDLQGQIDGITVELTQAEYDALTEEEKNNGTIYFITDAPSGITIDSQLSVISTNAVQNRVITSQVNKILSEAEIQAQINDRIYQGTDLTVKFADEISASPYNGDPWAWIKARIQANNFAGIHVCDYIPVTTTNSVTLNAQIAGINTYKNYGDSPVGAHIDFICKELWPTMRPVNKVNYNNGTAAENHPWLASDLYLYLNSLAGTVPSAAEVGGGEGTAVDYTESGVYYYLPTQLKNVIIEKRFLLPTRYSASRLLTDDNSWAWKNIGKLWLPDECEVYGVPVWGGKGGYSIGGSGLQYPLFAGNMNRLKFRNGSRSYWWLLSPYSGDSTHWCFVDSSGACYYSAAPISDIAAPVCFRVG